MCERSSFSMDSEKKMAWLKLIANKRRMMKKVMKISYSWEYIYENKNYKYFFFLIKQNHYAPVKQAIVIITTIIINFI